MRFSPRGDWALTVKGQPYQTTTPDCKERKGDQNAPKLLGFSKSIIFLGTGSELEEKRGNAHLLITRPQQSCLKMPPGCLALTRVVDWAAVQNFVFLVYSGYPRSAKIHCLKLHSSHLWSIAVTIRLNKKGGQLINVDRCFWGRAMLKPMDVVVKPTKDDLILVRRNPRASGVFGIKFKTPKVPLVWWLLGFMVSRGIQPKPGRKFLLSQHEIRNPGKILGKGFGCMALPLFKTWRGMPFFKLFEKTNDFNGARGKALISQKFPPGARS